MNVRESFGTSVTVTETHIVFGSGMFGDFNPLHVDEEFSKKSMFGGRILHGPFTSALVASPVGIYFAGTAIAYLEHSCRFKAPVRAGDTIATRWTVTAMNTFPTTEHADAVRAAVREFAAGEIAPLAAEIDQKDESPGIQAKRLTLDTRSWRNHNTAS